MKCYIYFIINQVNGLRYVGQTTNFNRRKNEHIRNLEEHKHVNSKLQAAWNKYGKENFIFEKITYDNITKEELNNQEIYYIEKFDTYNNGYNLTIGGDGGETRNKLSFDQYCFAFFGNRKYDGMTNRTGKYLGVDSACIAAIRNEKSYNTFMQKALALSIEEQEAYIEDFEKIMDIKANPPWTVSKTPDKEITFIIMCLVSTYGRGIEAAVLKKFGLSKGFVFHLMTGKGRESVKQKYASLSQLEIEKIGEKYFIEWDIQNYSNCKIKKQYTNLLTKYKS